MVWESVLGKGWQCKLFGFLPVSGKGKSLAVVYGQEIRTLMCLLHMQNCNAEMWRQGIYTCMYIYYFLWIREYFERPEWMAECHCITLSQALMWTLPPEIYSRLQPLSSDTSSATSCLMLLLFTPLLPIACLNVSWSDICFISTFLYHSLYYESCTIM